jgi:hypothetical protein
MGQDLLEILEVFSIHDAFYILSVYISTGESACL